MLLVGLGCTAEPAPVDSAPESTIPPGCGDGVLQDGEACDDGEANDDATPDACRTTCLLPVCADGVVDAGETCDDAGEWGGDGCDTRCLLETGALEVEPNETWDIATPATARAHGSLPEDDVDCFSFPVSSCAAIDVRQEGPCTQSLTLALHDPTGALVAVGAPDDAGCAVLDPVDQPGARWVAEGTWSVCVSAVHDAETRGYTLAIAEVDAAALDAPQATRDLDGDGAPDTCDADMDGDGLPDLDDDCPEISNGPDTPSPALSADGFVRHWLGAGPFTTGETTDGCRPSEDLFVGEDTLSTATFGDPAGALVWEAHLLDSDVFDFLDFYATVSAPRESYALVYLSSATARSLTLAVGADDGVFAWWNGERVMDVAGCQGVNTDQFTAPVEVAAGWNTLLFKVRDQGGAWGVQARFYDTDGAIVTDLVPSLVSDTAWIPGQGDAICD